MSGRIFQSVIVQMKEATERMIGVIDADGMVISCTNSAKIGEKWQEAVTALAALPDSTVTVGGMTFKPLVRWSAYFDYAVFVEGEDELAKSLSVMAAVSLNGAKTSYEEKHDKGTFVKNVITDNILPGDVYVRAKELRFATDVPRVVFLVRQLGGTDVAAMDVLQGLFADKQTHYVISVNETDIAVVRCAPQSTSPEELQAVAAKIETCLREELSLHCVIGIGTVAGHLRDLADSYKEAQVAIEVGKVFDTEKTIIHYDNLGIGRLIYQLPTTLCEIFLSEVFRKNSIDALDAETLFTINKFFENNLNVSETSRKLFVHRNTLVYRLEKIKKLTGLDLREFDHAIVFKVALMVRKYLSSRDNRFNG